MKRARNQYGKVSKRVNNRETPGTRVDVIDGESDDQVESVFPESRPAPRRTSSRHNLKGDSGETTQTTAATTTKLALATRSRRG